MSKYLTLIIQIPDDAEGRKLVDDGLRQIASHGTALTDEDKESVQAALGMLEARKGTTEYFASGEFIETANLNDVEALSVSAALSLFNRIRRLPLDEQSTILTLLQFESAAARNVNDQSFDFTVNRPRTTTKPILSVESGNPTPRVEDDKPEPL